MTENCGNDPDLPANMEAARERVVDPSEAVTGMGFVFGAVGVVIGIIAAVVASGDLNLALVGYCALAALAGGSAGVVVGGLIGAVFAVFRGVAKHSAPSRVR